MEIGMYFAAAYAGIAISYVWSTLEHGYGCHHGRYNDETQVAHKEAVGEAKTVTLELVRDRKRARLLITTILVLIVLWRGVA